MAWAYALALLSLVVASSAVAPHAIALNRGLKSYVNYTGNNSTTMFLPLFFNSRKVHRSVDDLLPRRYLEDRSSARMSLHDDLLLNGYYTTRLWIGTPPQKFALIVDTGSTVTYVPCATCEQCGKHQDPRFQPEDSSTYQPKKCNIDCSCDSNRQQCVYERQYAEMSSSSGVLGEDIVSFGNESELEPQRAVFGCENMETGDLYSQHADGIMGLGRGDLSIVDQLVDKGVISDSFSLCYGGMDVGGGAMVLGGIPPPDDMVFTHSDPVRSPYYNIDLREIHVAGHKLPLDPKVFDGKHGTVLDSGTTYAYFPQAAFSAFKAAIFKELQSLKKIQGPDPNYNDICFAGAGSDTSQLSKSFPSVEMVFENAQKILLSPENYLFRHSKVRGAYCLGVFQNGKDPTTLLGGIIVRNTLVTYDREHDKVGFWKTNCSQLWEGLTPPTPPPPPPPPPPLPPSDTANDSTIPPAPMQAPSQPPLPGTPEIKIGVITFHMMLTVKYQDLKPNISELTEFIANELGVNASQVQLMDSTSSENGTIIKWAIFPTGSDDYISNATAMNIISKLSGSQMHLPDKYGSFKLFEWKIEPPPERTWWEQHYLALVITLFVMVIVGMAAAGVWYVHRREKSLVSYKPVEAAIAEQELQPLQNNQ